MPASGSGNVQSRRSHTKSRKGCRTCKRRHIRCDENFPQCRNCTKHNVRCDYMDMPLAEDQSTSPDLNMTPQIQQEIEAWRNTGVYPFPGLGIVHTPLPSDYSFTDLRLIHHISSMASQMQAQAAESTKHAVWTKRVPLFLRIASENNFVMHSLMGLSASHLSWITNCGATLQLAYTHRGLAFKGLQEAIGNFSKANSDAVLAASILLSWQVTDWRSWAHLMQGTSTVIDAMQEWKHESEFKDYMEEKEVFSRGPTQPQIADPNRDRSILKHVHSSLVRLNTCLGGNDDEKGSLTKLITFIQELQPYIPVRPAEHQFQLLYPLRSWLFFLPLELLRRGKRDPRVMVLFAHFYGVALAVEPLFPAVGAAYFGSMSIGPIEDIHQTLMAMRAAAPHDGSLTRAIDLLEFPLNMVQEFRNRMDWRRLDEIQSSASPRIKIEADALHIESTRPAAPHSRLTSALQGFDWSAFESMGLFDTPAYNAPSTPSSGGSDVHGPFTAPGYGGPTVWKRED